MQIEVDQSWRIDQAPDTVVAAADKSGYGYSVSISSNEKRKLQIYFRKLEKPRIFVYFTFCALVFLSIKNVARKISHLIIDTEYQGNENLIKDYLLRIARINGIEINKRDILFVSIGKESPAHALAYKIGKGRGKAKRELTASQVITLYERIFPQK